MTPAAGSDPGERGSLELRSRAVERLVSAAAGEVDGTSGGVSRVLGRQVRGPAERPQVSAEVTGDLLTASIVLSLPWGVPLAPAAAAVRASVRDRVTATTGLRVGHLDVVVRSLLPPRDSSPAPRVV